MFTGIITDIGEVTAISDQNGLRRLTIASSYPRAGIAIGASIAHAGICLTVTTLSEAAGRTLHTVDASQETMSRTTLGAWSVGHRVNLERSLKVGDELGGHIVTGHVDALATILTRTDSNEVSRFDLEAPPHLAAFIAEKGSVALDGTSLTVNGVEGPRFTVTLIPHSLAETTWGAARAGQKVNLEVDMMARYAARLADARASGY